jgi:predicted transposase YbfD/YdcC
VTFICLRNLRFVALKEHAAPEAGPGRDESDQAGCVHGAPAGPGGLDELVPMSSWTVPAGHAVRIAALSGSRCHLQIAEPPGRSTWHPQLPQDIAEPVLTAPGVPSFPADGTAVRGAKAGSGKAPHLVAALAHGIGAVLGQVTVDARSNEIPAVRDLLRAFASLASAVITIGAMHTQSDTAQVILGRGADYVMTVKGSMPTLCRQLKKLPRAAVPAVSSVSTDHGRRARRTIKAVLAPAWIEFHGAAQVAQLRRTVIKKGKKTVEVVYLITSDRDADPATLAARARGHGEIENKLHWVRDVT